MENTIALLPLIDCLGKSIPVKSIIYGNLPGDSEMHYFNIGISSSNGTIEMIACTYGYVHDVKQSDLLNFKLIGATEDNLHLLECD